VVNVLARREKMSQQQQQQQHLMDNTVDPKMWPGTTDAETLARLPWHSTSTNWKFSVPLKHFLCPHSQHVLGKSVALARRTL